MFMFVIRDLFRKRKIIVDNLVKKLREKQDLLLRQVAAVVAIEQVQNQKELITTKFSKNMLYLLTTKFSLRKITSKFIFSLCLLLPVFAYAKHTVGGNMTYSCLGNGDYLIELIIYRDCASDGAPFDEEALIAIYKCGNTIPCTSFQQGNQEQLLRVPLNSSDLIPPPVIPCLKSSFTPCIERGRYLFRLSDYGILLDLTEDSYHIVYQRCCRNETISNLLQAEETGNTYTVEITSLAQEVCNSSPNFDSTLPSIICANIPLNLQQFISEPDGDSLVFKFSSVISGGGPDLSAVGSNLCGGSSPDPPCPPPFQTIDYSIGFEREHPFGSSDEPIVMNAINGIISGVPTINGQFVFGVEIMEYRNGDLLSKIHREFQFNVLSCEETSTDEACNEDTTTTSTYLLKNPNLTIYPNPVKDFIQLKLHQEEVFKVSLLTMEGKILLNELQQTLIDVSNFPAGLYLVKVELLSDGQVILNKILVLK